MGQSCTEFQTFSEGASPRFSSQLVVMISKAQSKDRNIVYIAIAHWRPVLKNLSTGTKGKPAEEL